eukprot:SAG25_NODE_4887_length_736_cov_1.408163_1_plen_41_part_10
MCTIKLCFTQALQYYMRVVPSTLESTSVQVKTQKLMCAPRN